MTKAPPPPDNMIIEFPLALREALLALETGQMLYMSWYPMMESGRLGSAWSGRLNYSPGIQDQPELAFIALTHHEEWPGGWGSLRMQTKATGAGVGGDYHGHQTLWLQLPHRPPLDEKASESDWFEAVEYAKGFVVEMKNMFHAAAEAGKVRKDTPKKD